jgi:hypothetical protein
MKRGRADEEMDRPEASMPSRLGEAEKANGAPFSAKERVIIS